MSREISLQLCLLCGMYMFRGWRITFELVVPGSLVSFKLFKGIFNIVLRYNPVQLQFSKCFLKTGFIEEDRAEVDRLIFLDFTGCWSKLVLAAQRKGWSKNTAILWNETEGSCYFISISSLEITSIFLGIQNLFCLKLFSVSVNNCD